MQATHHAAADGRVFASNRHIGLAKVSAVDPVLQPHLGLVERSHRVTQKLPKLAEAKPAEPLGNARLDSARGIEELIDETTIRLGGRAGAYQAVDLTFESAGGLIGDEIVELLHTHVVVWCKGQARLRATDPERFEAQAKNCSLTDSRELNGLQRAASDQRGIGTERQRSDGAGRKRLATVTKEGLGP